MQRCECPCVCCDTQVFVVGDNSEINSLRCPSCGRHLTPTRIDPFGERDWEVCDDPDLVVQAGVARLSNRQARLFACACCRLFWDRLTHPRYRDAVEVAELFADGRSDENEVRLALDRAVAVPRTGDYDADPIISAACESLSARPHLTAIVAWIVRRSQRQSEDAARLIVAFRDIMPNPFMPPPPLTPPVLAWNGGQVRKLAEGIYRQRDFEALPILADALEEAGCTDQALLNHCRSAGGHVLGCWAVDLARATK
jgi:hypothetical protein